MIRNHHRFHHGTFSLQPAAGGPGRALEPPPLRRVGAQLVRRGHPAQGTRDIHHGHGGWFSYLMMTMVGWFS